MADTGSAIKELSEIDNRASILASSLRADSIYDVGINPTDIEVERGTSQFTMKALVRNLGDDIQAVDYSQLSVKYKVYNEHPAYADINQGSVVPDFEYTDVHSSVELAHGGPANTEAQFTGIDPVAHSKITVQAEAELKQDYGGEENLDQHLGNNTVLHRYFIGKTNLQAVSLTANPTPVHIVNSEKAMGSVNLQAQICNGNWQAGQGFVLADGVHVEIRDADTSRVLGYWNNLKLPALSAVESSLVSTTTLSLPDVELPPGTYHLQVEIDPVKYFVETNETDNIADLYFTITDKVEGRPLPDLGFGVSSTLDLEAINSLLYARVTVENLSDQPELCAASAPVSLKLYESTTSDSSTSIALAAASVTIPALAAGETYTALVPTGLTWDPEAPQNSFLWAHVDCFHQVAERSEINNTISAQLTVPEITAASALGIFDMVRVTWTPVAGASEYRIARYQPGNPNAQVSAILAGSSRDFEDRGAGLVAGQEYYYKVWARSGNGLWGLPAESNTVTLGKIPLITTVYHYSDDATQTVITAATTAADVKAITVLGSTLTLVTSFEPGATLELQNNYEPVSTALVDSSGNVNFTDVPLTDFFNEFRVSAVQQAEGKTYSALSNRVIVYHDIPQADLTFDLKTDLSPAVSIIATGDGGFNHNVTSSSDGEELKNKHISITATAIDKEDDEGDMVPVKPFWVYFEVKLDDGTVTKTSVLAGSGEAVVFPVTVSWDLNQLTTAGLACVSVRLDSKGASDPGEIAEKIETNNYYSVSMQNGNDSIGSEYQFPVPYNRGAPANLMVYASSETLTSQTVSLYRYKDGEFRKQNAGIDELNVIAPISEKNCSFWLKDPLYFLYGGGSPSIINYTYWINHSSVINGLYQYLNLDFDTVQNGWIPDYEDTFRIDFLNDSSQLKLSSEKSFGLNHMFSNGADVGSTIFPSEMLGTKYILPSFYSKSNAQGDGPLFQIFAIDGELNETTLVKISQNSLGFPRLSGSGWDTSSSSCPGKVTNLNDRSYTIALKPGEVYTWRFDGSEYDHYVDPSGISIESLDPTKRIGVFSAGAGQIPYYTTNYSDTGEDNGRLTKGWRTTMVPPNSVLGNQYVLTPPPLCGDNNLIERVEANEHFTKSTSGEPTGAKGLNYIHRVYSSEDNTSITISPGNKMVCLQKGQFVEIGANSLPYRSPLTIDSDPFKSDFLSLQINIKRFIDTEATTHTVSSNKPIMISTYLLPTYFSGETDIDNYRIHGFGGTSMYVNCPINRFSKQTTQPIMLANEFYDKDWEPHMTSYSGNFYRPYWFQPTGTEPVQIISLYCLVSQDVIPDVNIATYTNNFETSGIDYFIDTFPETTTTWTPVMVDGKYSGVKTCDIELPSYSDFSGHDIHQYYVLNPSGIPLSIRQVGYKPNSSYSWTAGIWESQSISGDQFPIDLEITASGIRFPKSKKLIPNVDAPLRLEILNNGTTDVLTEHGATISLWEQLRQTDGSTTEVLIDGWEDVAIPAVGQGNIQCKRLAPYIIEFNLNPKPNLTGIRARISMIGDGDPTNNEALFVIPPGTMRPDFGVRSPLEAAWPASYTDSVQVTATVTLKDYHVDQVPLRWTYGFNGGDQQTTTVLVRFLPDSVETTSPRYQAATTVTLSLPHPGYGGTYTISAEVNPDSAAAEQTVNADVNLRTVDHNFEPGNLSISTVAPVSALSGKLIPLECTITNTNAAAYTNVQLQVTVASGGGVDEPVLFRQLLPVIAPGETLTFPAQARLYASGTTQLRTSLIVPAEQLETTLADNTDLDSIRVFDSGKSDLAVVNAPNTLAVQPPGSSALPVEVTRGDTVDLDAIIQNLGRAEVTSPYKVQIFDGGQSFSRGRIVAETLIDNSEESVQALDEFRELIDEWETSQTAVGEHTLTAVVDSPDHLAVAATTAEGEVSRVPMLGNKLTSQGISLINLPQELAGSSWTLELYATSQSTTEPAKLLGSFRDGSGFVPTQVAVDTTTNVQLQLKTMTGELFPRFTGPINFELQFIEPYQAAGTEHRSTLVAGLPSNENGSYGRGASFWLADDGSTYFTRRLHMAKDYGTIGSEDMPPAEAMNDLQGMVEEDNEFNNIFTQTVIITEEDEPNLVITDVRPLPSPQSPGRTIAVDVDIANTAADCNQPVEVALTVKSAGSPDSATTIGLNRMILEPVAHGASVTRRFEWETSSPGSYDFYAEADPLNQIIEVSDDDNGLTVTASVTASTTMTFTGILDSPYGPNEQVPAQLSVSSDETSWGVVTIHVLNADTDQSVAEIDLSREVPFPLNGTRAFNKTWNTGSITPGEYVFEARLKHLGENGFLPGEQRVRSEVFTVEPVKLLTTFIQTERAVYNNFETVRFVAGVRNDTPGYTYPELNAQVEIYSDAFSTETLGVSPIVQLLPGDVRLAENLIWTIPGNLPDIPVVYARLSIWEPGTPETVYGPAVAQFAIRNSKPLLVIDEPTSGSYHNTPVLVNWSSPSPVDIRTSEGIVSAVAFNGDLSITSSTISSGDYVSTEGIILVDAYAQGYFGQDSVTTSVMFYVDRTSPTIALTDVSFTYSGTSEITFTGDADDGFGSGIDAIEMRPASSETWQTISNHWFSGNEAAPTKRSFTHTVSTSDPSYPFYVRTRDKAGNLSNDVQETASLDIEAPQITAMAPVGTTVTQSSFVVRVHVTDDFAGIASNTVKYKISSLGLEDGWFPMTMVSGTSMDAIYEATVTSATRYSDSNAQIQVRASDLVGHNESTSISDANPATWSNWIDFDIPPQIPTGLRAFYSDSGEVNLSWNTNTEPDFGTYRIKREVTSGSSSVQYFHNIPNDTQATTNQTTDSTVANDTARYYKYSMLSIDVAGNESEWCQAVLVLPPGRPEDIRAIGSSSSVRLNWPVVTEGFVDQYRVYRGTTYENKPSYSLLTTIDVDSLDPEAGVVMTTDTAVAFDQIYFYYVVAVDKAGNKSFDSDIVRAETRAFPSIVSLARVTFEDITRNYTNLWDFNDVGTSIYARAELTPEDNVSTITLFAVGSIQYDSAFGHDLYLSFFRLNGTANWNGVRFDRDKVSSFIDPVIFGPGVFDSADSNSSIPLFISSHISVDSHTYDETTTETRGINGDWSTLIIKLNNPAANPASTFELAPFDTFIVVHPDRTTSTISNVVGIYDPLRPETQNKYFKDFTRVSNYDKNDPLQDTELPSGLVIPYTSWLMPEELQALWKEGQYPYFRYYAPTLNSLLNKYRNWYEFRTLSDF